MTGRDGGNEAGGMVVVADKAPRGEDLRPATTELATALVDTGGDTHGSTGYRRRLFAVLAARELSRALRRAREGRTIA